MNTQNIVDFFRQNNYDIKIAKNARFMDQKVTPDVLSIVSDCIVHYLDENLERTFTSSQIRNQIYANEFIKSIFNKPEIGNEETQNEYDKFFQQPLKMLAYAGILQEKKIGRTMFFTVINMEILEYISISERNALNFIQIYLEKVLNDSGLLLEFNNFFSEPTKMNYKTLKDKYEAFIIENTPINNATEVRRIFTKVINPLAFKEKTYGTRKGFLSNSKIEFNELMYNRINFRDLNKEKSISRTEAENLKVIEIERRNSAYVKYNLNKTRKLIDKYYSNSEIDNQISLSYHLHHIFPKNEFPKYERYVENLIKLTPTQHYGEAHPLGNTHYINEIFQKLYLLKKIDIIQEWIEKKREEFYSKECLVELLNECLFNSELNLGLVSSSDESYDIIKAKIIRAYEMREITSSRILQVAE